MLDTLKGGFLVMIRLHVVLDDITLILFKKATFFCTVKDGLVLKIWCL